MTLRWITFVEIDVSVCSLTYGVPPCMASIGVTGDQRCFNTVGSCQDRDNYTESFVTLRFVQDTGYQAETDIEAFPSLVSVETRPAVVSLGETLGSRPQVTCVFRDHPHTDTGPGFDRYLSTRSYNPYNQGTFWGKFAVRHPNIRGKKLRVIQGHVGQDLADMEIAHYIVDSVDGPSLDGSFRVIAKDPLKALDDDRAVAPAVSSGVLVADITSSAVSAVLSPGGVGADYPSSGYANISGEIVSFTRSADTLTITRAQFGTTGVAHKAGDRVQVCLVFSAVDPATIISTLLTTYGGIDSSYIPLANWITEVNTYNGQVYTACIPEPTGVKTLVEEIIEEAGLAVWWDVVGESLRLQVLRSVSTDAETYDDTIYKRDSLQVTAQPDKRKSEIWVYFAQVSPLDGIDLNNLPGIFVNVSLNSEKDYGSAQIKVIKSRWIPTGGKLIAQRLSEIQLGRYLYPPRKVQFQLPADGSVALPLVGDGRRLSTRISQDLDGSLASLPFTVTSRLVKQGICTLTGEEINWTELRPDPFNRTITIESNLYNQNVRTLHDNLYGAPTAGGTVTLNISSIARIGSTSTSTFALDTGDWPTVAFTATRASGNATLTGIADTSAFVAGQAVTGTGIQNGSRVVSKTSSTVVLSKTASASGTSSLTLYTTILKFVVDGRITGMGGKGGDSFNGDNHAGNSGSPGGPGLKVRVPVDLSGAGKIDGGGGGGGAGTSDYIGWFGPQVYGGSGGGGAGDLPGSGGAVVAGSASGPASVDHGGVGGSSGYSGWHGGNGGDPGQSGSSAGGGDPSPGAGAGAGNSVDGYSLVLDTAYTGVYRGAHVN